MDNYTYASMLTGYRDRVLRIALFDIFAMLEHKQMKDDHGKPIDFFGLGLLSLLFFFESMLMRIKKEVSTNLETSLRIRQMAACLFRMKPMTALPGRSLKCSDHQRERGITGNSTIMKPGKKTGWIFHPQSR